MEATDGNQPVSLSAPYVHTSKPINGAAAASRCNFRGACHLETASAGVGACDLDVCCGLVRGKKIRRQERTRECRQRPRYASVGICGSKTVRVGKRESAEVGEGGREGEKRVAMKSILVPSVCFQIRWTANDDISLPQS